MYQVRTLLLVTIFSAVVCSACGDEVSYEHDPNLIQPESALNSVKELEVSAPASETHKSDEKECVYSGYSSRTFSVTRFGPTCSKACAAARSACNARSHINCIYSYCGSVR